MARFPNMDRKIDRIEGLLGRYGISSLEEAEDICLEHGVDPAGLVKGTQPICFSDAPWAYIAGGRRGYRPQAQELRRRRL